MEYYFNNLDPTSFQRLINSILVARFGEDARLTPLRSSDGGRDGETAPGNPYFEYQVTTPATYHGLFAPLRKGRYLFQVKHHRTVNTRISDVRKTVVSDFEKELRANVLSRAGHERVNYFFLITNVPSSKDALAALDKKRTALLGEQNIHADIWWEEQVIAYLDMMPSLWSSFPAMFAGGIAPVLAEVVNQATKELPRAVRLALDRQYTRDSSVKFRQIDLERSLSKLFVDLDVSTRHFAPDVQKGLMESVIHREKGAPVEDTYKKVAYERFASRHSGPAASTLGILLEETTELTRKIILEGGPGQGKSTITQMAAQIYRHHLLGKTDMNPEGRWVPPQKFRLPLRIELKNFAEWLSENAEASIEEYLAHIFRRDSGGSPVSANDIHNIVEGAPVILIFDGLDEVGSDDLRDTVLERITDCVDRFENNLRSDLRVVVTSRPPAMAGRRERLVNFAQFPIAPMEPDRIKNYVERWLSVQVQDSDEREDIRNSFTKRQNEPHVKALINNPMQLSVLLHFIRLKGVAFPDRRAELYRDYFRIVIDRDVEKSAELRKNREIIEALHQLLGYKIHALTEVEQADGTLSRWQLLQIVEAWLKNQGTESVTANNLFKVGEERLGLIVSPKGEGEEARYGYEIQPIREYFAAAYINEQIRGNAHNVFQTLVRRSFWREVALFLAGLRRPNEKADLLTRAKSLDKDDYLGWRQDGRAITLQLLQEGVFSQPEHVFMEALEYIIDSLDPELVTAQNEPKELLEVLPTLIKQREAKRHLDRLLKILHHYKTSQDERLIYRLFRVVSQLLKHNEFRKEVMDYKGADPDLLAKARLEWPYSWGIDMHKAAQSPLYWEKVPQNIWAENWWKTAIQFNLATNLPASHSYHQSLAEKFATDPSSIGRSVYYGGPMWKPLSNWAIWKLVGYQKLFYHLQSLGGTPKEKQLQAFSELQRSTDVDFTGLNEETRNVITDLIEISEHLANSLLSSEIQVDELLSKYIPALKAHLEQPSLNSWLVCRWTLNLLKSSMVRYGFAFRHHSDFQDQIMKYLLREGEGKDFLETVRSFYVNPIEQKGDRSNDIYSEFEFVIMGSGFGQWDTLPIYVRLENKGELTSVTDLLADHLCKGKELPFNWLKNIPLTIEIIRPLIEKCRQDLTKLLPALMNFPVTLLNSNTSLLVQDIQRILKIARSTSDPKTLAGAIVALSTSKYVKIAGPKLILKLLRTEPSLARFNTQSLFKQQENDFVAYRLHGGHEEKGGKDIQVANEVANGVLRSPEDYALEIVLTAARHLAEHSQINLPPLQSEEEKLELQVR